MNHELLEGALATLHFVPASDKMLGYFERPTLRSMTGQVEKPDLAKLVDLIDSEELAVWEIVPEGATEATGYALYVNYDGPPYFVIYNFDEEMQMEIARECMLQLIPLFFNTTEEEVLYFYADKNVAEELHDELLEAGFDPFEDNPIMDKGEMCYILERHTYDAYYGEEASEDDLKFRDGY